VRRIGESRDFTQQIDYHLADGRAPEFDKEQAGRVALARFLIDKIIVFQGSPRVRIIELGCGAGDVSGPYSNDHEVTGYDVTFMSEEVCARRWPNMKYQRVPVETISPEACDILVMTEFLEHVHDPVEIVHNWLPLAKWSVIGHPLDEPDPPFEPGHIWSYTRDDWRHWFQIGGHQWLEEFRFPMGGWDAMILGHSRRAQ